MERQSTSAPCGLDSYILESTPECTLRRYRGLAEYAQHADFGPLDEDVVVIDTETTGLSFNHDELIQIAAARMVKGEVVGWYTTFVNPGKPIPDEVAHLTNIHDEDVATAPDPDTAVRGLAEFVGTSDVVAHNANFDRTFCTKYAPGEVLKQNIWIDSLDLARIALPRFASHRLLDLVRAFGGPESTHRADDDVTATCMVYRVLLAAVAAMPQELVNAIAGMATVGEWNTVYVFQQFAAPVSGESDEERPYNLRAARRSTVSKANAPVRFDADSSAAVAPGAAPAGTDAGSSADPVPAPPELKFALQEEIAEAFSEQGLVGQLYDDYEPRAEQREMALAVNDALRKSRNLVVEAGTGVGKSMAYLVPLALTAQANNITVGVATKTNALLDQLVHKELPLLNRALGITYAPLKGFTHYPCLRKVETVLRQGPGLVTFKGQTLHQAPALAGLLSFIEQTDYDDMDALKIDYRAIPRWRITTKSAECLRRKCPFFGRSCFVHGAREQAKRCDVVVTNHSLLYWDAALDGGLLPPIRHWVVDEAHSAESEARRAFSQTVSSDALRSLARRVSDERATVNVLLRVQRSAQAPDEGRALYEALIAKARTCGGAFAQAAEEFSLGAKDLLAFDPRSRSKGYEYFYLWLGDEVRHGSTYAAVRARAKALYETLEKLIRALRDVVAYAEQIEDNSPAQRELALVALELREAYDALEANFLHEEANCVYSVRLNRKKSRCDEEFTVQPLDVGASLNDSLYATTRSIVYTSATLSVGSSFDAFTQAIGLNQGEDSAADAVRVDSSFDFDANMRVYVPTDMPEPNDPAYLPALQRLLANLHCAQGGSLLTLFTNRREMEHCFDAVNPILKQHGLRLVCQKWGVSVKGLRDDFLKDESLSLFALKSFWEGFDAPGSTLRGVVIPKLPFGLPTDPLSCERQQRDDRAWQHYSLPAAVIDVKQAVGRLIRTSTDKGIVVLADKRLISKYYGKIFLNSLPSHNIAKLPCAQIVEEVRAAYERETHQSGTGAGGPVGAGQPATTGAGQPATAGADACGARS